jgi:hypothetical protein
MVCIASGHRYARQAETTRKTEIHRPPRTFDGRDAPERNRSGPARAATLASGVLLLYQDRDPSVCASLWTSDRTTGRRAALRGQLPQTQGISSSGRRGPPESGTAQAGHLEEWDWESDRIANRSPCGISRFSSVDQITGSVTFGDAPHQRS